MRPRAADDRSVRAQVAAALLVGFVLVAVGLYMWRRPRHSAEPSAADLAALESASAAVDLAAVPPAVASTADSSSPVKLSDARVLGCHDRGPRKTPVDQCDHLAPVEKALTSAVEHAAACVPDSTGGGTIEYVADISFLRHKVNVLLPRAGRSVSDRKVIGACGAAVRSAMQAVSLDGMDHQHARYKISVTATYRHSAPGG